MEGSLDLLLRSGFKTRLLDHADWYDSNRKTELLESNTIKMKTSSCRFVLSKIIEDEVAHEYGYDIFEPTVGLEIAGKNIFNELGLEGSDRVVIMHFLEI